MTVAIIGAGLAGLAASSGLRTLGIENTIFESKPYWGGHTYSDVVEGFTFDEGPHVSFTNDERVRDVFTHNAGSVVEVAARVANWFEGHWIKHPAQVHLYGLDPELIASVIADLVEAHANPPAINNYADWLVAMYGVTFAERFPFRYTRKYWTVEPEQLGTDWVGSRMYPPTVAEVERGALDADNGDFHYIKSYRYPETGGYASFARGFVEGADLQTSKAVVAVDVGAKVVGFSDGTQASYTEMISSMPLDKLVHCIEGVEVPPNVLEAADKLLCSSVVLVDVGVSRSDLAESDWFYVYDEDMPMARVHFPHRLAPKNVPEGMGSVQAEIYFSREKPLSVTPEDLEGQVVSDLMKMGVLKSTEEVLFTRSRTIEYANIVFDHNRQPSLDVILPFIESCGITLAGRFGEWGYHWTDDAVKAGWVAAAKLGGVDVDVMLSKS